MMGRCGLTYRRNEVRIDQARLHGPNTDVQFSGSARFDRDRPLHLSLAGSCESSISRSDDSGAFCAGARGRERVGGRNDVAPANHGPRNSEGCVGDLLGFSDGLEPCER